MLKTPNLKLPAFLEAELEKIARRRARRAAKRNHAVNRYGAMPHCGGAQEIERRRRREERLRKAER